MSKVRVNLLIDEKIWREFKEEIKDAGYPRGAPSWLAQRAFEKALEELRTVGMSSQLEMFDFIRGGKGK
jgi:hypothetical protein